MLFKSKKPGILVGGGVERNVISWKHHQLLALMTSQLMAVVIFVLCVAVFWLPMKRILMVYMYLFLVVDYLLQTGTAFFVFEFR